jgi:hypothetical protein
VSEDATTGPHATGPDATGPYATCALPPSGARTAAQATGGTGLRGLADRVDVLGGRLLVDSPPGGGTRIVAEVPCGS